MEHHKLYASVALGMVAIVIGLAGFTNQLGSLDQRVANLTKQVQEGLANGPSVAETQTALVTSALYPTSHIVVDEPGNNARLLTWPDPVLTSWSWVPTAVSHSISMTKDGETYNYAILTRGSPSTSTVGFYCYQSYSSCSYVRKVSEFIPKDKVGGLFRVTVKSYNAQGALVGQGISNPFHLLPANYAVSKNLEYGPFLVTGPENDPTLYNRTSENLKGMVVGSFSVMRYGTSPSYYLRNLKITTSFGQNFSPKLKNVRAVIGSSNPSVNSTAISNVLPSMQPGTQYNLVFPTSTPYGGLVYGSFSKIYILADLASSTTDYSGVVSFSGCDGVGMPPYTPAGSFSCVPYSGYFPVIGQLIKVSK